MSTSKRVGGFLKFVESVLCSAKACRKLVGDRRVRFEHRKACRNLEKVWKVCFDNLKACRIFVNVRKVCFEHRSACRNFIWGALQSRRNLLGRNAVTLVWGSLRLAPH